MPVTRAVFIFAIFCSVATLAVALSSDADRKGLMRGISSLMIKHVILWTWYLTFWWRLATRASYRQVFACSFVGLALVNLAYCLLQRRFGLDWLHGLEGRLPDGRFSGGVFRVSGFMGHPLTLAYCQALAAVAALGLFRSVRERWEKFAWLIGSMSCAVVVLVSGSRGPQLALILSLFLSFPIRSIAKRWDVTLLILLVVGFLGVNYGIFERFTELTQTGMGGDARSVHWQVFWKIFTENLWVGIGPGGRDTAISAYYLAFGHDDKIRLAHNAYLQYAAEYGVLGLLGLSFWVVSLCRVAASSRLVGRVLWALIFLTCFGALTQNNLQDSEFVLALTVWMMLLVTVEVESGEPTAGRRAQAQDLLSREGRKSP
jgi:O-antigen ligase